MPPTGVIKRGSPVGAPASVRLCGLDDQDGAARLVGDRIGNAAEDSALHALTANHQEVGPTLLRKANENVARVPLVDQRATIQPARPQSGLGALEYLPYRWPTAPTPSRAPPCRRLAQPTSLWSRALHRGARPSRQSAAQPRPPSRPLCPPSLIHQSRPRSSRSSRDRIRSPSALQRETGAQRYPWSATDHHP
jgi:hypothetical protein